MGWGKRDERQDTRTDTIFWSLSETRRREQAIGPLKETRGGNEEEWRNSME